MSRIISFTINDDARSPLLRVSLEMWVTRDEAQRLYDYARGAEVRDAGAPEPRALEGELLEPLALPEGGRNG